MSPTTTPKPLRLALALSAALAFAACTSDPPPDVAVSSPSASTPDPAPVPPSDDGETTSSEGATACYRNEFSYSDGSDLADVEELTVQVKGSLATGTYNWLPAQRDARHGSFEGTAEGSTISATYRFVQEGMQDTAQIEISLGDDQAVVSGGPEGLGLAATLPRADC